MDQELFLVIAGMAWAFDVRKKRDAYGNEVEVPLNKYTSLLIAKPEKFEFDMVVRGEDRRKAIEEGWKEDVVFSEGM